MFRFRFCFLIAWLFLFSSCVPNKYPRVLSGIELAAGSLVMADSSLTGAEAAGLVDPQVAARLRADGTEVFNALSEGLAVVNQAAADAEARGEELSEEFGLRILRAAIALSLDPLDRVIDALPTGTPQLSYYRLGLLALRARLTVLGNF